MNDRLMREQWEVENLSECAMKSVESSGRFVEEEPCELRTIYQRDRDRILHSKAFRRLKHKTQVFLAPAGDHYRTRLTHTLEVSQIARTIGRALDLNEDLIEAIALGHDLGHTPFGHSGEVILDEINPDGFKHNEYSLFIVDHIERHNDSAGLNLSMEVRDGILNHTGDTLPMTLEGQVVKIADRIAYLNHDIDDSIRAGILSESDLPKDCTDVLGMTRGDRIETMVEDIVANSEGKNLIQRGEIVAKYSDKLREFMFEAVYHNPDAKYEEEKAKTILKMLYYYYKDHYDLMVDEYKQLPTDKLNQITYYIAGMTDRYALEKFKGIYLPSSWGK